MINLLNFLFCPIFYKDLFTEMVRIHFLKKFKNSIFKYYWIFIHQTFLVIFYAFIFSYLVSFNLKRDLNYDYSIFIISGLIPWFFFVEILSNSNIINEHKEFLDKKKFPFEIIFFERAFIALINFIINTAVLITYAFLKFNISNVLILLTPILLVFFFYFALSLLMLISLLNLLVSDTKEFIRIFLIIGLFITPTIYLPDMKIMYLDILININPFSYFIYAFRDLLFYNQVNLEIWSFIITMTLFFVLVSYYLFYKFKSRINNFL